MIKKVLLALIISSFLAVPAQAGGFFSGLLRFFDAITPDTIIIQNDPFIRFNQFQVIEVPRVFFRNDRVIILDRFGNFMGNFDVRVIRGRTPLIIRDQFGARLILR